MSLYPHAAYSRNPPLSPEETYEEPHCALGWECDCSLCTCQRCYSELVHLPKLNRTVCPECDPDWMDEEEAQP